MADTTIFAERAETGALLVGIVIVWLESWRGDAYAYL